MKKILTLIAAVMMTVCASAEETVLFESADGVALSWSGTYVDGTKISASTGLTLHVTIKTTSGDWWQYKLCQAVEGWPAILVPNTNSDGFVTASTVAYSWAAGTYTQDFELTDEMISQLKSGVYFQGSISNSGNLETAPQLLLMKVTVTSEVKYADPVDISSHMDAYGNILAEYFEGYSDDAKVEFIYNVEGYSDDIKGWGAGSLKSIDGTVDTELSFPIKAEGENITTTTIGELKTALTAGPDTYGRYGLYWNMWGCVEGNTNTRAAIKIYEIAETITTNENGVASYVTTSALDFSNVEGLKAYLATEVTSSDITLVEATKVPAGTALVVKGTASSEFNIPVTSSAEAVDNKFLASDGTITGGANIYALAKTGVFKKVASSVTIPAGKAYLVAPAGAKDALTLNFGEEATAINAVETVNTENGIAYNLAGQRVNRNAKGIVIINGKKMIVK